MPGNATALDLLGDGGTPITPITPIVAPTPDATLYELTENMKLDNLANPTERKAMAALQGSAKVGTALCPLALIQLLQSFGLLVTSAPCAVTAVGRDVVDLATGSGTLEGEFAVVVNADNAVDGPELVVMEGVFHGNMQLQIDMTTVPPSPLPLITIPCTAAAPAACGTLTPTTVFGVPVAYLGYYFPGIGPEMFAAAPFGGVFRLPFVVNEVGRRGKPRKDAGALYLGDTGEPIAVNTDERSLGMPTVRVEITFGLGL